MCRVTYTEISFKGNNTKIKNCNCCKGQVRIANYFTEPSCFFVFFLQSERRVQLYKQWEQQHKTDRNREALNEDEKLSRSKCW